MNMSKQNNDYKKRLENILEENKVALSHIEKEYKGNLQIYNTL